MAIQLLSELNRQTFTKARYSAHRASFTGKSDCSQSLNAAAASARSSQSAEAFVCPGEYRDGVSAVWEPGNGSEHTFGYGTTQPVERAGDI